MQVLDGLLTRRSVRQYTEQAIDDETMMLLLKAAMAAPSAGNQQPWHFVMLQKREIMVKIQTFHPYSHMLDHAAAAIVVCADLSLERFKGYWVQDCAAATQNILIAAHSLGLGAVWLGIYPQKERVEGMKQLLDLPESIMPLAVVALGCPAEEKEPSNRFQKDRIHFNQW